MQPFFHRSDWLRPTTTYSTSDGYYEEVSAGISGEASRGIGTGLWAIKGRQPRAAPATVPGCVSRPRLGSTACPRPGRLQCSL